MKYLSIYKMQALFLLITLLAFGACDKSFLEVIPKGKLIVEKTYDYDKILNSTNFTLFSIAPIYSVLGDEVVARDPLFGARPVFDQRLFRFEDNIFEPAAEPTQITALTKILYVCNKIINEVMLVSQKRKDWYESGN